MGAVGLTHNGELTMTKKDYQLIAEAISNARSFLNDGYYGLPEPAERKAVRFAIYRDLADSLAADNPRFDRVKFRAACGLD